MTRKKNRKKTVKSSSIKEVVKNKQFKFIFGTFLMLFAIFLIASFASFLFNWKIDQSQLTEFTNRNLLAHNLLGKIGAVLSDFFVFKGFGVASFILPILLFFFGLFIAFNTNLKKLQKSFFWGLLALIWIAVFFGFVATNKPILGGTVGYELNDYLKDYIGKSGIILLLIFGLLTYLALRFNFNLDFLKKLIKSNNKHENKTDLEPTIASIIPEHGNVKSQFELSVENLQPTIKNSSKPNNVKTEEKAANNNSESEAPKENFKEVKIEIENTVEEKSLTENLSDKLVKKYGEFDPKLDLSEYKFPPLNLLKEYLNENITIDQNELEVNKNRIVQTLNNYNIGIASIKATIGPTVTLYEIVPDSGVRISKIKNLEDDIALSLSALGIRIIAPIPGKGTIGIEVPNKNPTIVSMRSVLSSQKFQKAQMELPLAIGKTISNETYVIDLVKMPHLLIAGATGQGKSVGLNAILASLLYKKHPAEVKFVLVDPKKVELTLFNKIERHYLAKLPDSEEAIITDTTKVINTLNSLCIEMDARYDLLKNAFVRNIKEYNVKFKTRKLNPNEGHKFLPYIVLVIDEFADLIMTAGKEIETPIARLAQLARAVGIHLIVATQRPSVNVITGIIKANFPARIAFRVTSTGNDLKRLQCAFVDTPEIEKITDFIGSQRAYPTAHILPEFNKDENGTSLDIDISDRDKLFVEAAKLIVNAQQGSASLLQRKLKLGYNRAGRIIDQLEAAGIVGQFEGSKARQVLVPDEFALEQLLTNEK